MKVTKHILKYPEDATSCDNCSSRIMTENEVYFTLTLTPAHKLTWILCKSCILALKSQLSIYP